MALDPRKQQKKLERRKAKEKKRALMERKSRDPLARFERAIAAPVLDCCVAGDIWTGGIGSVLWSRELASGSIAFASFLVDTYCLGVKDAFCGITSRHDYDFRLFAKHAAAGPVYKLTPECARKLVEGAVAYAREIGLPPHADYEQARLIFGDIDAAVCPRTFTFGKDGKPCFIAGPRDSAARCERIVALLESRLGPNGFHFVIPASRAMSVSHLVGIESEEGDEGWEE